MFGNKGTRTCDQLWRRAHGKLWEVRTFRPPRGWQLAPVGFSPSGDCWFGFFGLVPASSAVPTAAPEKQHYEVND